jgi:hypothetical protein
MHRPKTSATVGKNHGCMADTSARVLNMGKA